MNSEYYQSVGVIVKDNNVELALKKFKRKIKNCRILIDYKERMFFEKPSVKKRKKKLLSKLRNRRENNND